MSSTKIYFIMSKLHKVIKWTRADGSIYFGNFLERLHYFSFITLDKKYIKCTYVHICSSK